MACLAVVLFHAWPHGLPGGFAGVDVFFVISGYLIAGMLYALPSGPQAGSALVSFYLRRVLRLAPALLAVMAAALGAGWCLLLPGELAVLGHHLTGSAAFISNFVLLHEYAGYFRADALTRPLLHLWSLGIEEQFYLCFPPLLLLTRRLRLSPALWVGAAALLALALSERTIAGGDAPTAFFLPWLRSWELGAGALLAWAARRRGALLAPGLPAEAAALTGLALLSAALWGLSSRTPFPGAAALLPVTASVLLIAAGSSSVLCRRVLGCRLMAGLGLISYPLYLWHWPLLSYSFLRRGAPPPPAELAWLLAASLVLAVLTWRCLELPLRFSARPRGTAAALLGGLFMLGATGAWLHHPLAGAGEDDAYHGAHAPLGAELRRREERCHERYPQWAVAVDPRNSCFMAPGGGAAVWVLGDSHAGQLLWGLQPALERHGVSLHVFGSNSQPPLLGLMAAYNASSRIARDTITVQAPLISRALLDFARDPRSRLAVLAHNPYAASVGLRDLTGALPPLDLRGRGRSELSPAEEQQLAALYESAARRTFDLLAARGKRVLLVLDAPLMSRERFSRCLASFRPGAAPAPPDVCSQDRNSYDTNRFTQTYNRVMRSLAGSYDHVSCVDLAGLLCDQDLCHMARGGQLLYEDPGHFSAAGSRLAAEWLLTEVLAALRQPPPGGHGGTAGPDEGMSATPGTAGQSPI